MISSFHLSPFSDAYMQLFDSTSPLSHQICILNITHPKVNSWFPQSMLLSQFSPFQLISTPFFQLLRQLLKNFESIIQKRGCYLFYLLSLGSDVKTYLAQLFFFTHVTILILIIIFLHPQDYCNVLLISSLPFETS